jgi:hypothetical protein
MTDSPYRIDFSAELLDRHDSRNYDQLNWIIGFEILIDLFSNMETRNEYGCLQK